jgi:hypothetical protein
METLILKGAEELGLRPKLLLLYLAFGEASQKNLESHNGRQKFE